MCRSGAMNPQLQWINGVKLDCPALWHLLSETQ
jgi:hypothetical protein